MSDTPENLLRNLLQQRRRLLLSAKERHEERPEEEDEAIQKSCRRSSSSILPRIEGDVQERSKKKVRERKNGEEVVRNLTLGASMSQESTVKLVPLIRSPAKKLQVQTPYGLETCTAYNKAEYIMSPTTLTKLKPGLGEVQTIGDWVREASLFRTIRNSFKIFRHNLEIRCFRRWSSLLRQRTFRRQQRRLARQLIHFRESFAQPLFDIIKCANKIRTTLLLLDFGTSNPTLVDQHKDETQTLVSDQTDGLPVHFFYLCPLERAKQKALNAINASSTLSTALPSKADTSSDHAILAEEEINQQYLQSHGGEEGEKKTHKPTSVLLKSQSIEAFEAQQRLQKQEAFKAAEAIIEEARIIIQKTRNFVHTLVARDEEQIAKRQAARDDQRESRILSADHQPPKQFRKDLSILAVRLEVQRQATLHDRQRRERAMFGVFVQLADFMIRDALVDLALDSAYSLLNRLYDARDATAGLWEVTLNFADEDDNDHANSKLSQYQYDDEMIKKEQPSLIFQNCNAAVNVSGLSEGGIPTLAPLPSAPKLVPIPSRRCITSERKNSFLRVRRRSSTASFAAAHLGIATTAQEYTKLAGGIELEHIDLALKGLEESALAADVAHITGKAESSDPCVTFSPSRDQVVQSAGHVVADAIEMLDYLPRIRNSFPDDLEALAAAARLDNGDTWISWDRRRATDDEGNDHILSLSGPPLQEVQSAPWFTTEAELVAAEELLAERLEQANKKERERKARESALSHQHMAKVDDDTNVSNGQNNNIVTIQYLAMTSLFFCKARAAIEAEITYSFKRAAEFAKFLASIRSLHDVDRALSAPNLKRQRATEEELADPTLCEKLDEQAAESRGWRQLLLSAVRDTILLNRDLARLARWHQELNRKLQSGACGAIECITRALRQRLGIAAIRRRRALQREVRHLARLHTRAALQAAVTVSRLLEEEPDSFRAFAKHSGRVTAVRRFDWPLINALATAAETFVALSRRDVLTSDAYDIVVAGNVPLDEVKQDLNTTGLNSIGTKTSPGIQLDDSNDMEINGNLLKIQELETQREAAFARYQEREQKQLIPSTRDWSTEIGRCVKAVRTLTLFLAGAASEDEIRFDNANTVNESLNTLYRPQLEDLERSYKQLVDVGRLIEFIAESKDAVACEEEALRFLAFETRTARAYYARASNLWLCIDLWNKDRAQWFSTALCKIDADEVDEDSEELEEQTKNLLERIQEPPQSDPTFASFLPFQNGEENDPAFAAEAIEGIALENFGAARRLAREVNEFRLFFVVALQLKNRDLKWRHWRKLSQHVLTPNQMFDPNHVTLQQLIDAGVHRLKDYVHTLSSDATNEARLEATVNNLQDAWDALVIPVVKLGGTSTCILAPLDDIHALINQHREFLRDLAVGSHGEAIQPLITAWRTRVDLLAATLQCAEDVTHQIGSLEPLFGDAKVDNDHFARAWTRFAEISSSWRKLLERWYAWDTKPMDLVTRTDLVKDFAITRTELDDFQHMPRNICDKNLVQWRSYLHALDELRRELSDHVAEKRSAFPRFYFLSDSELISILGVLYSKDPDGSAAAIRRALPMLFAAVTEAIVDSENRILSITDAARQSLKLESPVQVLGAPENWLNALESEIAYTLRTDFGALRRKILTQKKMSSGAQFAWHRFDDAGGVDRAAIQNVLLLERISWTAEITQALSDGLRFGNSADAICRHADGYARGLADCAVDLRRCKFVVSSTHIEDSVRQLAKREAWIVLSVFHRDATARLAACAGDLIGLEDFAWQSQLRFYLAAESEAWAKSTYFAKSKNASLMSVKPSAGGRGIEETGVVARQMDAVLPGGTEFVGCCSQRIAWTELSHRCILTLTAAVHAIRGVAMVGPYSVRKSETVKSLAAAMHTRCFVAQSVDFGLSTATVISALGRIFSGIAATGTWFFFQVSEVDLSAHRQLMSAAATSMQALTCAVASRSSSFVLPGEQSSVPLKPFSNFASSSSTVRLADDIEMHTGMPLIVFALSTDQNAQSWPLIASHASYFRPTALLVPELSTMLEVELLNAGFSTVASQAAVTLEELFAFASRAKLGRDMSWDLGIARSIVCEASRMLKRTKPQIIARLVQYNLDADSLNPLTVQINETREIELQIVRDGTRAALLRLLTNEADQVFALDVLTRFFPAFDKEIFDEEEDLYRYELEVQLNSMTECCASKSQRQGGTSILSSIDACGRAIIVGPAACGKSTLLRSAAKACTAALHVVVVAGLDIESVFSCGAGGPGLLSKLITQISVNPNHWIILDAPSSAVHCDAFMTILDKTADGAPVLLETESLADASPMLVSRMGTTVALEDFLENDAKKSAGRRVRAWFRNVVKRRLENEHFVSFLEAALDTSIISDSLERARGSTAPIAWIDLRRIDAFCSMLFAVLCTATEVQEDNAATIAFSAVAWSIAWGVFGDVFAHEQYRSDCSDWLFAQFTKVLLDIEQSADHHHLKAACAGCAPSSQFKNFCEGWDALLDMQAIDNSVLYAPTASEVRAISTARLLALSHSVDEQSHAIALFQCTEPSAVPALTNVNRTFASLMTEDACVIQEAATTSSTAQHLCYILDQRLVHSRATQDRTGSQIERTFTFSPRNDTQCVILIVDDLSLPPSSLTYSSKHRNGYVDEFLRSILDHDRSWYQLREQVPPTSRVDPNDSAESPVFQVKASGLGLVAVSSRHETLSRRLRRHLIPISIAPPSDADLRQIFTSIASHRMCIDTRQDSLARALDDATSALLKVFNEIRAQIPFARQALRIILRIARGLEFGRQCDDLPWLASPPISKIVLHELCREVRDCLTVKEELSVFDDAAVRHFRPGSVRTFAEELVLNGGGARVYMDPVGQVNKTRFNKKKRGGALLRPKTDEADGRVERQVHSHLQALDIDLTKPPMDIVVLRRATQHAQHAARLARILQCGSSAVLVGSKGIGRRSCIKLATHMAGIRHCFDAPSPLFKKQARLYTPDSDGMFIAGAQARYYDGEDIPWLETLRKAVLAAGKGETTVVVISDTSWSHSAATARRLDDLDALVRKGSCIHILRSDDIDSIVHDFVTTVSSSDDAISSNETAESKSIASAKDDILHTALAHHASCVRKMLSVVVCATSIDGTGAHLVARRALEQWTQNNATIDIFTSWKTDSFDAMAHRLLGCDQKLLKTANSRKDSIPLVAWYLRLQDIGRLSPSFDKIDNAYERAKYTAALLDEVLPMEIRPELARACAETHMTALSHAKRLGSAQYEFPSIDAFRSLVVTATATAFWRKTSLAPRLKIITDGIAMINTSQAYKSEVEVQLRDAKWKATDAYNSSVRITATLKECEKDCQLQEGRLATARNALKAAQDYTKLSEKSYLKMISSDVLQDYDKARATFVLLAGQTQKNCKLPPPGKPLVMAYKALSNVLQDSKANWEQGLACCTGERPIEEMLNTWIYDASHVALGTTGKAPEALRKKWKDMISLAEKCAADAAKCMSHAGHGRELGNAVCAWVRTAAHLFRVILSGLKTPLLQKWRQFVKAKAAHDRTDAELSLATDADVAAKSAHAAALGLADSNNLSDIEETISTLQRKLRTAKERFTELEPCLQRWDARVASISASMAALPRSAAATAAVISYATALPTASALDTFSDKITEALDLFEEHTLVDYEVQERKKPLSSSVLETYVHIPPVAPRHCATLVSDDPCCFGGCGVYGLPLRTWDAKGLLPDGPGGSLARCILALQVETGRVPLLVDPARDGLKWLYSAYESDQIVRIATSADGNTYLVTKHQEAQNNGTISGDGMAAPIIAALAAGLETHASVIVVDLPDSLFLDAQVLSEYFTPLETLLRAQLDTSFLNSIHSPIVAALKHLGVDVKIEKSTKTLAELQRVGLAKILLRTCAPSNRVAATVNGQAADLFSAISVIDMTPRQVPERLVKAALNRAPEKSPYSGLLGLERTLSDAGLSAALAASENDDELLRLAASMSPTCLYEPLNVDESNTPELLVMARRRYGFEKRAMSAALAAQAASTRIHEAQHRLLPVARAANNIIIGNDRALGAHIFVRALSASSAVARTSTLAAHEMEFANFIGNMRKAPNSASILDAAAVAWKLDRPLMYQNEISAALLAAAVEAARRTDHNNAIDLLGDAPGTWTADRRNKYRDSRKSHEDNDEWLYEDTTTEETSWPKSENARFELAVLEIELADELRGICEFIRMNNRNWKIALQHCKVHEWFLSEGKGEQSLLNEECRQILSFFANDESEDENTPSGGVTLLSRVLVLRALRPDLMHESVNALVNAHYGTRLHDSASMSLSRSRGTGSAGAAIIAEAARKGPEPILVVLRASSNDDIPLIKSLTEAAICTFVGSASKSKGTLPKVIESCTFDEATSAIGEARKNGNWVLVRNAQECSSTLVGLFAQLDAFDLNSTARVHSSHRVLIEFVQDDSDTESVLPREVCAKSQLAVIEPATNARERMVAAIADGGVEELAQRHHRLVYVQALAYVLARTRRDYRRGHASRLASAVTSWAAWTAGSIDPRPPASIGNATSRHRPWSLTNQLIIPGKYELRKSLLLGTRRCDAYNNVKSTEIDNVDAQILDGIVCSALLTSFTEATAETAGWKVAPESHPLKYVLNLSEHEDATLCGLRPEDEHMRKEESGAALVSAAYGVSIAHRPTFRLSRTSESTEELWLPGLADPGAFLARHRLGSSGPPAPFLRVHSQRMCEEDLAVTGLILDGGCRLSSDGNLETSDEDASLLPFFLSRDFESTVSTFEHRRSFFESGGRSSYVVPDTHEVPVYKDNNRTELLATFRVGKGDHPSSFWALRGCAFYFESC